MLSNTQTGGEKTAYVTILASDGTFRLVVPTGTPGSILREYELKDGTKGSKNELVFQKMTGIIQDVSFFDGSFGRLIQLDILVNNKVLTLSCSSEQNYGEDIMKKLPNIKLDQVVELSPYAFTDEKGKIKKGMSIVQDGAKVQNFFYDAATKAPCNGMPVVPKDKMKKSDWQVYFIGVREFLIEYTEKHFPTKKEKIAKREALDVSSFFTGEEGSAITVDAD